MTSLDPMAAFAELGRIRLLENSADDVLGRIAAPAAGSVSGAQEVSVALVRRSAPHSVARTGEVARELDESQYRQGCGPGLLTAAYGTMAARTLAQYATFPPANVDAYDRTATLAQQLRQAMAKRAVIEQTKGIVIAGRHCSPGRSLRRPRPRPPNRKAWSRPRPTAPGS